MQPASGLVGGHGDGWLCRVRPVSGVADSHSTCQQIRFRDIVRVIPHPDQGNRCSSAGRGVTKRNVLWARTKRSKTGMSFALQYSTRRSDSGSPISIARAWAALTPPEPNRAELLRVITVDCRPRLPPSPASPQVTRRRSTRPGGPGSRILPPPACPAHQSAGKWAYSDAAR